MPETTNPQPDRIPISRSVSYAVRGAPELPARGTAIPGTTLAPSQVTFTYRAAPDSQLGRIAARVTGFWKRDGGRVNPGQPMAQHYFDGHGEWPEWLAEEARLHDPDAASPSASADRADEIERLRTEHATWRKLGQRNLTRAHQENACLRADQAAALERIRVAVRRLAAHAVGFGDVLDESDRGPWGKTVAADIAELRRMVDEPASGPSRVADEAPQPETQAPVCMCGHPMHQHHEDVCLTECGCNDGRELDDVTDLPGRLAAALTARFTELSNPFAAMRYHEQGPDGWPASHSVGPNKVADVLRELLSPEPPAVVSQPETQAEAHPPTVTWQIETPRRGEWRHTGVTYDDHAWVTERFQDAVEMQPDREFRLVRGTTAYVVEAEHDPAVVSQPGKEA